MTTEARFALVFAAMLAVALIVTLPLAIVLPTSVVAARAVSGTIWSGRLTDAVAGRVPLGTVDVAVRPLSLLSGAPRVALSGAVGRGTVSRAGVDDATAQIPLTGQFGAIPIAGIGLEGVSVRFDDGRCARAQGRVSARFSGAIGGLSLAQGLTGAARCDGADLLLPLVSQSAMERLNMRVAASGRYRAEFIVKAGDEALAGKLGAAGFRPAQGGLVLRLSGTLQVGP